MFSDVTSHLVYQVLNAPIRDYPFPHFYTNDLFPESFYAKIMEYMPDESAYISILDQGLVRVPPEKLEEYEQRSVITLYDGSNSFFSSGKANTDLIEKNKRSFWIELGKILSSPEFSIPLLVKFKPWIMEQYGEDKTINYGVHIDLIRDNQKWAMGPHTDHPINLVVILIYLPKDDSTLYLGTSIYTPKEPGFTCVGGPQYDRGEFDCASTVPYLPNSAIGFLKNDTSFHGVETVQKAGVDRNLIQLSITKA